MCLYQKPFKNRKYTKTKKNGGQVPPVEDRRVTEIMVDCGNCMECREKKTREWKIRLYEEIQEHPGAKMIVLTFSNESIRELIKQEIEVKNRIIDEKIKIKIDQLEGYEKDNAIAKKGMRLFLERWRKKTKKSVRHWFITELGHEGTENIHLHGLLWTDKPIDEIKAIWQYGFTWPRSTKHEIELRNKGKYYTSNRTINYMVKYVTKMDLKHKGYKPKILNSSGIGIGYIKNNRYKQNEYNGKRTNETYRTTTGHQVALPTYYRNKIYSEDEKERLWIMKLDAEIKYIKGEKIKTDTAAGKDEYNATREHYRKINKQLGYGDDNSGIKKEHETQQREAMIQKRIKEDRSETPRRRGS